MKIVWSEVDNHPPQDNSQFEKQTTKIHRLKEAHEGELGLGVKSSWAVEEESLRVHCHQTKAGSFQNDDFNPGF